MSADGKHKCPVEGCSQRVPQHILMCRPHWFRVSVPVRNAVTRTWAQHGQNDWMHPEYTTARQAAIDEVNAQERGRPAPVPATEQRPKAPVEELPASKHGRAESWGTCRSCQARIIWVRTKNDRPMPVDPDTDESHFASCDAPDRFRKGR